MSTPYRRKDLSIPWLVLVLVLLVIGSFIIYTQSMEHRRIKVWEQERLITQAKVVEENLVRQLEGVRRSLEGIRNDIPHWRHMDEWQRASQRLVAMSDAMPGVRTFIITDAEGMVIAANRTQLIGRNFREREYFQTPRSRPDPDMLYISPPFKTSFGIIAINVGRVITGPGGTFAGVVSATLSPEYFTILLESILYAPDMWISLTHGDGDLFLKLAKKNAAAQDLHPSPAGFFTRHRASGQSATVLFDTGTFSDEGLIVAQRTIQPPGLRMDRPLVVAVARNMVVPYEEWRHDSQMISIVFGGFAFALTAGLYLFQRSQRVLHSHERLLGTLATVIPGLLSYWNIELCCTYANRKYSTWFGKTPEEMKGIHLKALLGDELFLRDEPHICDALNGREAHFERVLTMPAGEVRSVLINYMPDNDGGQTRGFYVLVTDVTELKHAQHDLEELNEELRQRIEETELVHRSKSRFLSTVAHEFRTPLSLLTSSTDILDRYGERLNAAENRQQREHIRNAARQMSRLIDSVLTFNRLDTNTLLNTPVLVDVGQFCCLLADEMKSAWSDGHTFNVSIADNCGTALLDEQLFRRVLENLLSNAFRYTHADGSVSLRVSRERHRLHVVITDSGIGIPEECRCLIFEAFYRCRNVETRRGLGLGLSIVHEALSCLGGNITVDSSIGEGTTMQVDIPLVNPPETEEQLTCTQF